MEEINLTEVFSYFKSKILAIIIVVLLILLAGNVYSIFFKTPMYQSNTTVLLVDENNTSINEL